MKRTGFSLLAIVALLSSLFPISGCNLTPNRRVYLNYGFHVDPLESEEVRNLVIYLPFPHYQGKPFGKGLRDLLRNDRLYHKSEEPATYSIVRTKEGSMLRVFVPRMKRGVGAGFEVGVSKEMPASEYYLWQNSGNHLHPFLYKPRFETRMKGKQGYAHTMIYCEGKGGNGVRLEMRYDISDRAPSPFPFIFGQAWGGDFLAFFGIEQPPDPIPGSAGVPIEIREFGWKKIPVAECE